MSGGPRKFSEKIALLNQKQAEGDAAFDSIMVEVKSIKSTTNSGSQLDILDSMTKPNDTTHASIEEAIASSEYVSVAYDITKQNSTSTSSSERQKHQKTSDSHKNNNALHHPMLTNNSYLQLPGQNDSFRRAHSDSSIHNTAVGGVSTNAGTFSNNFHLQNNGVISNNNNNNNNANLQLSQQHFYNQSSLYIQQQFQPQIYQQQQQQFLNNQNNQDYSNTTTNNTTIPPYNNKQTNGNNSSPSPPVQSPSYKGGQNMPLKLAVGADPLMKHQQNGYLIPKLIKNESAFNNFKNNSIQLQQQQSPTSPSKVQNVSSPVSPTSFAYNNNTNNNQQAGYLQPSTNFQFQNNNFQQPQQQQQQHQEQHVQNNNFLSANFHMNTVGSLPDLTLFQYTNHYQAQHLHLQQQQVQHTLPQNNQQQIVDYNNQEMNHQQQHVQMQHHQNNYKISSQLLQPNFPQHNHIGPVKSTSVSPTRGLSRYSPTNSTTNLNALTNKNNRRPSPQRSLKLKGQHSHHNSPSHSQITTPTSPISSSHPSVQSLPPLEFTVNSSHVNNSNNNGNSNYLSNNTNQNNSNTSYMSHPGGLYRNSGTMHNSIGGLNAMSPMGDGGGSLPPSPQSQQSCFNSPQGSPGPLSVSPQDVNPFTTNSYDIMHKKFDSINLDTNAAFNSFVNFTGSNVTLVSTSPGLIHSNPNSPVNNNSNNNNNMNNQIQSNDLNNDSNIQNINSVNNLNGSNNSIIDDANNGANIINSRSGSISSSGSSCNQVTNNDLYGDIDFNLNYQPTSNNNNNNNSKQLGSDFLNDYNNNTNNNNNHNLIDNNILDNSNGLNRSNGSKKSVPNIILTLSGDSIDEKDFTTDINFADVLKNDSLNLDDLQMLTETVNLDHPQPYRLLDNNMG